MRMAGLRLDYGEGNLDGVVAERHRPVDGLGSCRECPCPCQSWPPGLGTWDQKVDGRNAAGVVYPEGDCPFLVAR